MGIANPEIQTSKPFSDVLEEGQAFTLLGARVVENVKTEGFGEGDMVVLDVKLDNGEAESLGIWGAYLLAQVRSSDARDFPGRYEVVRDVVPTFSKRPVKMLKPVNADGHGGALD